MNYDKIGEFIKEKRKEKNLTQKELAEKLNVTDKAISKWERGQGCPDVSILEILSKELGCSILELLKGREIENEVIPVTEADDYIKEGMVFQKDRIKNSIKNGFNTIITIAIIFIVILLGYLNVIQYLYVIEEHEYRASSSDRKAVKANKEIIEKNIEIIKNNQGKYAKEDYEFLLENLEQDYENLQKSKLYPYILTSEKLIYNKNDLYLLKVGAFIYSNPMKLKETISKYDERVLNDYFFDFSYSYSIADNEIIQKVNSTNEYRITTSDDTNGWHIENVELRNFTQQIRRGSDRLAYLSELIIEVGDIHE